VKTQKANNKKKKFQETNSLPHCEDFQKMAEMMKTFCPSQGDAIDCCSIMKRMMRQGKGAEGEETRKKQKAPKCGENGGKF
jgi:hypothetical protein